MPALQTVIMGYSMGKDPSPIRLGVVNHEINGTLGEGCLPGLAQVEGCDTANLSCRFLDNLPKDIMQLVSLRSYCQL